MDMGFPFGVMEMFWNKIVVMLHNYGYILKTNELYT